MIKKIAFISLLSIVISCAFSTRGGISTVKPAVTLKAPLQDTVIKYVERPPLSQAQQNARDSALRKYIGSIIQPYSDDLKASAQLNTTNLTQFIQSQGNRLDSINNLRYNETYAYQLASVQRDSFLIQTILKDKRIDSLQKAVLRIEKTNLDANKIVEDINGIVAIIRDVAIYTSIGFLLVYISLTIFLEWIKSRKRKEYKFIKQNE